MNRQSWFRRTRMVAFYPIVAALVVLSVALFALLYNAGGANLIVQ